MAPVVAAVAEAIAMMNVTAIPAVVRVTRRYPTAPKTIARADAAGAADSWASFFGKKQEATYDFHTKYQRYQYFRS